jgi:hypothetical protein
MQRAAGLQPSDVRRDVSDFKGVPKRLAISEDLRTYPAELIGYADLIIREGRVVKDRHGIAGNREATPDEIEVCKELSPSGARVALAESAWRGEPPAEGSRRKLLFDTLLDPDVLSNAEALDFADSIESALSRLDLGADPEAPGVPASTAMSVLDRLEIPRVHRGDILDIAERVTRLADQLAGARREVARLRAGGRDTKPRLQTLQGAIDAAQLLSDEETRVLQAALAWDVESIAVAKRLMDHGDQLRHGDDDLPPCTCLDPGHGAVHDDTCVRGAKIRQASKRQAPFAKGDQVMAVEGLTDVPQGMYGAVRKLLLRDGVWRVTVKWHDGGVSREVDCAYLKHVWTDDDWKGTPPAEGTRRRLILDTLLDAPNGTKALELADAIESTLLDATIDDEATAPTGSAKFCDDQMASHARLREDDPKYAEYHRGAESAYCILLNRLRNATARDTVDRLEGICEERWRRIGELEDQLEAGDDDEDRVLCQREEARAGEDHFKAQRDSALNCLRWCIGDLLPNGEYNPGGPSSDPDGMGD